MPIPLKCPKCFGEFRAKEKLAGKRVKCPTCGQAISVPGLVTEATSTGFEPPKFESEFGVDDSERDEPETSDVPENEPAWSTPEWDDVDDNEEDAGDPEMPFPEAPVPLQPKAATAAAQNVEFGFGTIADFAMEPRLINFSLQWAGGLIVVNLISLLLFKFGLWWAAIPLMVLSLFVYAVGVLTSMSFMVSRRLEQGETPPTAEGWDFFLRRLVTILLGIGLVCLAVVVCGAILAVLVWAISHAPAVGTYIGAALIIPAFLFVLFTMSLFLNLYLMPIVVGVEDCTAFRAFNILRSLVTKNGVALYVRFFRALGSIVPFAIFSLMVFAVALVGALFLTGGENLMLDFTSLENLLRIASIAAIVLTYVSFLIVFSSVTFTLVYCESRRKMIVYD